MSLVPVNSLRLIGSACETLLVAPGALGDVSRCGGLEERRFCSW